jgi:hypothetical protein
MCVSLLVKSLSLNGIIFPNAFYSFEISKVCFLIENMKFIIVKKKNVVIFNDFHNSLLLFASLIVFRSDNPGNLIRPGARQYFFYSF